MFLIKWAVTTLLLWVLPPGQAKVNDFNLVSSSADTQDVLWLRRQHERRKLVMIWFSTQGFLQASRAAHVYLEVQMQDVHLVHVLQPFTDLPYKQHCVQFCKVVVLINDAVEEFASLHAASHTHAELHPERSPCTALTTDDRDTYYSMTRMMSWRDSKAAYSWMRLAWFSWFITWISFLTTSWET